jgi:hypothetical protein
MAEDLGFDGVGESSPKYRLKRWASEHPEIWGNNEGYGMFSSSLAFDRARNIPGIIQFLEGVRDRSPD